jgi:hypothetical protein|tara:strand:+ start:130 stop:336 length:207 start_codon:yes stop_codon:yes gene_type:complete
MGRIDNAVIAFIAHTSNALFVIGAPSNASGFNGYVSRVRLNHVLVGFKYLNVVFIASNLRSGVVLAIV